MMKPLKLGWATDDSRLGMKFFKIILC